LGRTDLHWPYDHEFQTKAKSVCNQLLIRDRWISARTLYGMYANEEMPMTPDEISVD
jgi:hypothetical protein